jgi:hypothetical protein
MNVSDDNVRFGRNGSGHIGSISLQSSGETGENHDRTSCGEQVFRPRFELNTSSVQIRHDVQKSSLWFLHRCYERLGRTAKSAETDRNKAISGKELRISRHHQDIRLETTRNPVRICGTLFKIQKQLSNTSLNRYSSINPLGDTNVWGLVMTWNHFKKISLH